jgi:hypothetical protein
MTPRAHPFTKKYRGACIKKLRTAWPGLDKISLRKIDSKECKSVFAKLRDEIDAQYYNNILGTFRAVLTKGGMRPEDDPSRGQNPIQRKGVVIQTQELPEDAAQVDELVQRIANRWHEVNRQLK